MEGIQNTMTASFLYHEWHSQEEYIEMTSDVLTSRPSEYMS